MYRVCLRLSAREDKTSCCMWKCMRERIKQHEISHRVEDSGSTKEELRQTLKSSGGWRVLRDTGGSGSK
jgi:arsenate reductase-like glutaredoxin family protein